MAKRFWSTEPRIKMSLTMRYSEADCLSRIVLFPAARGHDSRQAIGSLSLGVRQKKQSAVIFAALKYPEAYEEMHEDLVKFARSRFASVDSGLQLESWIWIHLGNEKVAIDTFSGMKHLIKSSRPGPHVDAVIQAFQSAYTIYVYPKPKMEPHEPE